METILSIIEYVRTHLKDIADAAAYIIAGASIIVKLTPSKGDDKVLDKIIKFVGKFIALNKNID